MQIKRTRFTQADGLINKGPKGGSQRFYRDALYSVLEHLKPKLCLEIGTYYGGSSAVFQEYFDKLCPEGKLVTCDVNKYTELNMPNVEQVLVYPHMPKEDMDKWHQLDTNKMLPDAYSRERKHRLDSVTFNTDILKSYGKFDFCFLDGDHTSNSAFCDFEIAVISLKNPKWILFDDVDEFDHECAEWFSNMKNINNISKNPLYNIYEFEDWDVQVGAALIWGNTDWNGMVYENASIMNSLI